LKAEEEAAAAAALAPEAAAVAAALAPEAVAAVAAPELVEAAAVAAVAPEAAAAVAAVAPEAAVEEEAVAPEAAAEEEAAVAAGPDPPGTSSPGPEARDRSAQQSQPSPCRHWRCCHGPARRPRRAATPRGRATRRLREQLS